ncbi:MAG TPA: putative urea ABC transporter substrate-binding protein [Bryobacteraceae bacterium]|jgi:NitT/TauT family transport system substrate-binding protein|nr:putative urea ABC transporter substrate-binding protein [Bryobacteraceae bacterium]
MRKFSTVLSLLVLAGSVSAGGPTPTFTVGWSVYVGWDPYQYMAKSGLLKKWADKYGITVKVQRFDYAPSLDAFVSRNIDACTMTNMEALDMPAAAGVDTTAILIGDYSNGNDAVLVRHNLSLSQIPGKRVLLVEKTVSQYLFERAMAMNNLASELKRVKFVNTSDSDIAGAFLGDSNQEAVVTWKPLVSQILKSPGITGIFDSSKIPGEILDLLVVRTDVLNRPDGSGQRFAKALAGAWYELLSQISKPGPESDKILAAIASVSEDTLASYKEQLSTTHMFYSAQSAVEMALSQQLKTTMELVRQFCFSHGLLGDKTGSPDDVAVRFPDGSIEGKKDRVRLRFDASYMQLAAGGKL